MNSKELTYRFARRAVLKGTAGAAFGTLMRPLIAAAEGEFPTRLLLIHKPCGTIVNRWMPTGVGESFELSPILKPFEGLKKDMLVFRNLTAPRDPTWIGDKHASGMIAFLAGHRIIPLPGETFTNNDAGNIASPERTVDQLLVAKSPAFQGTPIPSIQLAAYPETVPPFWPQTRVVSWSGPAKPLAPEVQPAKAYARIFGRTMGGNTQELERARAQKQSVLSFLRKDLSRLSSAAPASQRPKMDQHLDGIVQLERTLQAINRPANCAKPEIDTSASFVDSSRDIDSLHEPISKAHLAILKTAFQCDLTRVGVFSYAQGNSVVRFANKISNLGSSGGHHDLSHNSGAIEPLTKIDTWYSQQVAAFLTDLKNTPEGTGSMLDHTLVVYFSEVSVGWTHWHENLPIVFFGGANGRFKTGQLIDGQGRYTTDLWQAVLPKFGVDDKFGDPAWARGPLPGLG